MSFLFIWEYWTLFFLHWHTKSSINAFHLQNPSCCFKKSSCPLPRCPSKNVCEHRVRKYSCFPKTSEQAQFWKLKNTNTIYRNKKKSMWTTPLQKFLSKKCVAQNVAKTISEANWNISWTNKELPYTVCEEWEKYKVKNSSFEKLLQNVFF